jgi:uncharacterized protein YggE
MKDRNRIARGMLISLLMVVTLLALGACAPSAQGVGGEPRTITVTGSGEALGDPDTAMIQLGVNVQAEDVGEAVDAANEVIDSVTSSLVETGVDEVDIQTTNFSVWPEDVYDPEIGRPTGERIFHVDSTVSVIVRDISTMSDVISTGLEAGANNIFGISFSIDDTSPLAARARENAIDDAQARAGALAEGMGLTLGEVISVREFGGGGIVTRVESVEVAAEEGLGGGGPPISPGQSRVSVQVEVTYSIAQ